MRLDVDSRKRFNIRACPKCDIVIATTGLNHAGSVRSNASGDSLRRGLCRARSSLVLGA